MISTVPQLYRPNTRGPVCRHCRANPLDTDQPETHLCAECLDLAVWDSPCYACDRVPTGKPSDHCED